MMAKIYKVTSIIITILLIGTIVMLVLIVVAVFLLGGFMDFPCFVDYDLQGQCFRIEDEYLTRAREEGEADPQIELFLDEYSYLFRGGGCIYKESATNALEIATPARDLKLIRSGDNLEINGQIYGPGQALEITNAFYTWNPWLVASTKIVNRGLLTECDAQNEVPRLIVDGYRGTDISLEKGFIIVLVLFGLRLFVRRVLPLFGVVGKT